MSSPWLLTTLLALLLGLSVARLMAGSLAKWALPAIVIELAVARHLMPGQINNPERTDQVIRAKKIRLHKSAQAANKKTLKRALAWASSSWATRLWRQSSESLLRR
jgi:hypothetical protein